MDNFFILLLEAGLLASLVGLLITLCGARRAPLGFQHQNFFYYGTPPAGMIPVESEDSGPRQGDWL